MKVLAKYFVQGLLIVLPVGVTILVLVELVSFIGSFFSSFGKIIHPVVDVFIVISLAIVLVLMVGFMGSSFVFQPLFKGFERTIERAPLIKVIYSSVKDFMSAFFGKEKRFDQPVLIDIDLENNIKQMGFITLESLNVIGLKEEHVCVYLPFSYGFNGKLVIVPTTQVKKLNLSPTEAMKFIVSGGVTDLDKP